MSGARVARPWQLRSAAINEIVRAADQFEAWDTLRDRPADDFGLLVTAETGETGNPIPVRTSALMLSWGRDDDAQAFVDLAVAQGLPDTTTADRAFRQAPAVTCPVCERENGDLVADLAIVGEASFLMCRPCQRVSDIVQAAPIDAHMPLPAEQVAAWMRRLQDELLPTGAEG